MAAASGLIQAAGGFASANSQAKALEAQGRYQEQQGETNARLAEMQGEQAIDRGKAAAQKSKRQTKRMIGDQRAALAAQGQNLSEDDALAIQLETAQLGAEDVAAITSNAWGEAWGYRVEASNRRGEGKMAGIASRGAARNTLLTGGMRAFGDLSEGYSKMNSRNEDFLGRQKPDKKDGK